METVSKRYSQVVERYLEKLKLHSAALDNLQGMSLEWPIYDHATERNSLVRDLAHEVEEEMAYEMSEYQCSAAEFSGEASPENLAIAIGMFLSKTPFHADST